MNKIPAISWMKMIAIVSIHLCLIGWIIYVHRAAIGSRASGCWSYMAEGYGECEGFVLDVWNKIPAFDQLKEDFINILKLKPFN